MPLLVDPGAAAQHRLVELHRTVTDAAGNQAEVTSVVRLRRDASVSPQEVSDQ